MAAIVNSICMVLIAVVLVVAAAPDSETSISYDAVEPYLISCPPYVTNKGPIDVCCAALKGLYAEGKTTFDRQLVCDILQYMTRSSSDNVDLGKAAALPGQCGVNIPYEISPSTDCSKVT